MILGTRASRIQYLLLAGAICTAFIVFGPHLVQDEKYHHFAGPSQLTNTLTNLPFILIGAWGVWKQPSLAALGVLLTGLGSAYYHWAPDDDRLAWDRMPMTLVFMSLLATVIDGWAGLRNWTWPLAAVGIASVIWWHFTGDLRWYLVVQFGPILVLVPAAVTDRRVLPIWRAGAAYVAAKILEALDIPIYNALGGMLGIGGHSLKHLAAALAAYWTLQWIFTFSGTPSPRAAPPPETISIGH